MAAKRDALAGIAVGRLDDDGKLDFVFIVNGIFGNALDTKFFASVLEMALVRKSLDCFFVGVARDAEAGAKFLVRCNQGVCDSDKDSIYILADCHFVKGINVHGINVVADVGNFLGRCLRVVIGHDGRDSHFLGHPDNIGCFGIGSQNKKFFSFCVHIYFKELFVEFYLAF